MTPREIIFPNDFLWGTSTSAYQIEGGGSNTDWWRYERAEGTHCAEVCGDACDSWHRYEEDLDLVATLGLDSYRFSLEWSRIEPREGAFDDTALRALLETLDAISKGMGDILRNVVTDAYFAAALSGLDADVALPPRLSLGMAELDRALGGGLVGGPFVFGIELAGGQ